MSSNGLQIAWTQIRNDVKSYYTYLTDGDLDQIAGDEQRMVSKLQERYGYSPQQAQIEWDKFMSRFENSTLELPAATAKKANGQKAGRKTKM